MEFLSRLIDPICSRSRWLPAGSRITGIAFGILIALGIWLMLGSRTPAVMEALLDGQELTEPQIARMTAAFEKHGLDQARMNSGQICVPANQKNAYLVALDTEDAWPANFDAPIERALDKASPWLPGSQNRVNVELGEKQTLARVVEEMSGIESAVVQYDEYRLPGFPPKTEVRAMVAVKAAGRRHLEFEEIEAIRDTVVAYKSGLERTSVTITDLNACRAYSGKSAPDPSELAKRSRASAKRALEDEYQEKIQRHLAMYPDAVVAVTAHLAPDERPSVHPRASAANGDLLGMSVSISLPKSYFQSLWRQRHRSLPVAPASPAELQKVEQEVTANIQRAVMAIIPQSNPDWTSAQPVTVTTHEQLTATEAAPGSPAWTGLVFFACCGLLGIASLIFLLALRHRRIGLRKEDCQLGSPAPQTGGTTALTDPGSCAAVTVLQDRFTSLVRQDPAASAEILKQWLRKAA